jgi:hypothetical protein
MHRQATTTYWILEHSSRSRQDGDATIEPLWVFHTAYTMPSEDAAMQRAREIETTPPPPCWTTDHRFCIRQVGA